MYIPHVSRSAALPIDGKTPSRSQWAKRMLDVGLVLLGAAAVLPVMLLVAVAIKTTSAGPVFFVQKRVGRHGQTFDMIKFRSMYQDAEARRRALGDKSDRAGICFKIKNDPRITAVGRILRRLSLDELPQLLNVLRGDMSLVGPRPALPEEVADYSSYALLRLDVVPGITGAWQVSGRADLSFDQMVRLDIAYAQFGDLATDLRILLRTIGAVVGGKGAY